jgi:hypothetical protein
MTSPETNDFQRVWKAMGAAPKCECGLPLVMGRGPNLLVCVMCDGYLRTDIPPNIILGEE